jgi:hypothetical protein
MFVPKITKWDRVLLDKLSVAQLLSCYAKKTYGWMDGWMSAQTHVFLDLGTSWS